MLLFDSTFFFGFAFIPANMRDNSASLDILDFFILSTISKNDGLDLFKYLFNFVCKPSHALFVLSLRLLLCDHTSLLKTELFETSQVLDI